MAGQAMTAKQWQYIRSAGFTLVGLGTGIILRNFEYPSAGLVVMGFGVVSGLIGLFKAYINTPGKA